MSFIVVSKTLFRLTSEYEVLLIEAMDPTVFCSGEMRLNNSLAKSIVSIFFFFENLIIGELVGYFPELK